MRTIVTQGVVLSRTNYSEADRIATLLTPDQGKVRVLAKGVRKPKSKMASGIELFVVSDITFMPGKGELATLISARVSHNYANIVKNIDKTMYGYDLLKRIHKITEDEAEKAYFDLLRIGLESLNHETVSLDLADLWLSMQLLQLTGHSPNLQTDVKGVKLEQNKTYEFSVDDMAFMETQQRGVSSKMIKLMRLARDVNNPLHLTKITNNDDLAQQARALVNKMMNLHLEVK